VESNQVGRFRAAREVFNRHKAASLLNDRRARLLRAQPSGNSHHEDSQQEHEEKSGNREPRLEPWSHVPGL
jgi:hypothetical protein